jgi:DNA-binding transcriptional LysR family regulator
MLDALTLGQIRTFVAIAEAGSFRAGAARLLRAQSAVSHAIASLEAQLEVTLFDRSGHRPALTPQGRALLEDARAVLLRVDALRARARGLGMGLELSLPIVVDTLFPLPAIAEALKVMNTRHPPVQARVSVAPMGEPLAALCDGRCTLGITVGEDFRDPRVALEALATVTVVPVAAASHALADHARRGQEIALPVLSEHLQVVLEDPSLLSQGRDFGVLSTKTWRVNTQDAKHTLIKAGVGWGRLPSWAVQPDLDEGQLVKLNVPALGKNGESTLQAFLAHRTDQALGPAARTLREALLGNCAADHQVGQAGAGRPPS